MIIFSYQDEYGQYWEVEFGLASTAAGIEPAMRCRINGQNVAPEVVDRMLADISDQAVAVRSETGPGVWGRLGAASSN